MIKSFSWQIFEMKILGTVLTFSLVLTLFCNRIIWYCTKCPKIVMLKQALHFIFKFGQQDYLVNSNLYL